MKFAPATNQYGMPEYLVLPFVYLHGVDESCVAFICPHGTIKAECIKDERGRDALWSGYRGLIVARSDREHMYDALNKFIDNALIFDTLATGERIVL